MSSVLSQTSKPTPHKTLYIEGNGDTGSSGHFIPITCEHLLKNVQFTANPITVTCPDGSVMMSTKTAILDLPQIPIEARRCHLFPTIQGALLSIGKFCDHGMTATFDDTKVEIRNKLTGNIVLAGKRDNRGMYMIPLIATSSEPYQASNSTIYSIINDKPVATRVAFLSATLGNPADSTFLHAAQQGHLNSIPNITADQIRKYPPNSIESAKGHLDQSKQGTWSTKPKRSKPKRSELSNPQAPEPDPIGPAPATDILFMKLTCSSQLHGDSTGRFPVTSSKGNKKVLIGWCSLGNYIKSVAIAGDSADDFIKGYSEMLQFFRTRHVINSMVKIDNQTSKDLTTYFRETHDIGLSYAPPGNHRTLHAERDIRSWKNHFAALLAGVDPGFPKHLWDELLDHADLTLNMLRPCGVVVNTSAHDFINGAYNYLTNPIGPAGTKVLVFENPEQRASFADHGIEGYFLGTAWKHYRCFRVWCPSTRSIRTSDTLSWHCHDPFGLLSNNSTCETIHEATTILRTTLQHTTDHSDILLLNNGISYLSSLSNSKSQQPRVEISIDAPPPGFENIRPTPLATLSPVTETPTPNVITITSNPTVPVPIPRVLRQQTPVSIPRVSITTAEETPRASNTLKPSRNLKSNRHHIITDANPTIHNALKITCHKGTDTNPLKPLRFRVRWQGLNPSQDTYEPWEHVKDCQAALTYVENNPKLWYLLEPSLATNEAFQTNFSEWKGYDKTDVPWWFKQATYKSSEPETITRERAQHIAQAVMNDKVQLKHSLYYLLAMTPTSDMNHEAYAFAAGDMNDEGESLKYKSCIKGADSDLWIQASIKEFHKLFTQYNTMRPIKLKDIPEDKKKFITYYNPQCKTKMKPDGKQYRVRGTYGGNKPSSYTGVTASYQASMTTVKLLLNKTISDVNSKWMTMDVTDMYLQTRLPDDQYEYMVLDIQDIPQEIIDTYKLNDYISPGDTKVYVEVMGALYGMRQAGYLAHKEIIEHLSNNGYTAAPNTPCLFKHHTDDIEFTLITDDFGVRYGNKAAADKLLEVMSRRYPMTHEWEGKKYAGFDILFDYNQSTRRVEISMNGYIAAVLKRFKHLVNPTHNVYSPEFFQPINYGSKDSQLTKQSDKSPPLSATEINLIQQIVGCMLYYVRGVDATMLLTVDHISREQSHGTQETMQKVIRLLEYAATFPNATVVYYPSDMVLMSNVDGSYNSEINAQSRAAMICYCGKTNDPNFINGIIECLTTIIPTIVSSAAETEYASLFVGGKALLPIRYTLLDMDCIQPPTVITTDNAAAKGIATNTCKQRRSKSMDMRYHWIRDRVQLKDFEIIWRPGSESIADYLTKIQPVAMVLKMRKYYVKHTEPTFKLSQAKQQLLQT